MEKEISGKLYKLLACPLCKANMHYSKNNKKLICNVCKKEYNIKEGIPIMLTKKK